MKEKPRVTKSTDGWIVHRPRLGFADPAPNGPYPTHIAALESLKPKSNGSGMVLITETVETPEPPFSYYGDPPTLWPVVIR